MRFYTLTFILMATSASISLALPADPSSDKTASIDSTQWTCDNGWLYCGVCNGSSCKVGGINKRCVKGSVRPNPYRREKKRYQSSESNQTYSVLALRAEMASTAVAMSMASINALDIKPVSTDGL
ncbi:hypothetical protein N7453_002616 [Penicillium expansum]|nr:hypothetical protein N7453_002616 [Penicillium expansum]